MKPKSVWRRAFSANQKQLSVYQHSAQRGKVGRDRHSCFGWRPATPVLSPFLLRQLFQKVFLPPIFHPVSIKQLLFSSSFTGALAIGCFLGDFEDITPLRQCVISRYEIIASKWWNKYFNADTCVYVFPLRVPGKIQLCKYHHCEYSHLWRCPNLQQKVHECLQFRSLNSAPTAQGGQGILKWNLVRDTSKSTTNHPLDGNVQQEKQLSTEGEWVIQEKDTLPEKELMGRTEIDSPAPQVKAYFLWHRYLINALLTRGLTLQDSSPSSLQSQMCLSP